jgi:hypothetical protein
MGGLINGIKESEGPFPVDGKRSGSGVDVHIGGVDERDDLSISTLSASEFSDATGDG